MEPSRKSTSVGKFLLLVIVLSILFAAGFFFGQGSISLSVDHDTIQNYLEIFLDWPSVGILFIILFQKEIKILIPKIIKIGKEGILMGNDEKRVEEQSREAEAVSEQKPDTDAEEMRLQNYFYRVYYLIFGSQISILNHLNILKPGGSSEQSLRKLYEGYKTSYPALVNYRFEDYMQFLQVTGLVLKVEDRYALTELGEKFLLFVVKEGLETYKSN